MKLNPFLPSYEVLSASGFNVESHGSIQTTAPYLFQNDVPDYARHFYHPSEHEMFTSIKYGNFEAGYHGLSEIRESMNSMQFEFYTPSVTSMDPGVGRQDMSEVRVRDLADTIMSEAANEITRAQDQVRQSRRKKITVEETILLKRKRSIVMEESVR